MDTGDVREEQKQCEVGYWLCKTKERYGNVWRGEDFKRQRKKATIWLLVGNLNYLADKGLFLNSFFCRF